MAVYVCLKQIPNVEGVPIVQPQSGFLDAGAWLMNPLDGYALQEALQAANALGQACVAVSAGGPEAEEGLRLALALTAERALLVTPLPALAGEVLTAACLTALIRQDMAETEEALSLVFCGRQAADTAGMQVPYRLAGMLGCASVNDVNAWTLHPGTRTVRLVRQSGSFRQDVEADMPCVLAVNRGVKDVPRPTLPGTMKAKKKTIQRFSPAEAEALVKKFCPEAAYAFTMQEARLDRIGEPRVSTQVRMAQGVTIEEKVKHLIAMLREEGSL